MKDIFQQLSKFAFAIMYILCNYVIK
jgi:hypothetical protein